MRYSMLAIFSTVIGFTLALATASSENQLKPPRSFDHITNEKDRSLALFREAGKVIQHPRCVNCHPAGDRPLQGTDMRLHQPPVVRGNEGHGAAGMRCTTCHGEKNYDPAGVPGDPHWHLAPEEMAWQDKSLGDICRQIKDPERNGGRSMHEIIEHMANDSLVGWAWKPGLSSTGQPRQPAPGSQKELGNLIAAWVETGAACPARE